MFRVNIYSQYIKIYDSKQTDYFLTEIHIIVTNGINRRSNRKV